MKSSPTCRYLVMAMLILWGLLIVGNNHMRHTMKMLDSIPQIEAELDAIERTLVQLESDCNY